MSAIYRVDDPFTGDLYCEVPRMDAEQAARAVVRAAQAQAEWRDTPLDARRELCSRFLEAFADRSGAVAADITGQMGKPLAQARGEVRTLADRAQAMMDLAAGGALDPIELPPKDGFLRRIVREPVGVVLVVAPWNYPLLTAVNAVIPAVLAGDSVLLKHSSRTPLCANHFADAFAAAGAPEGLVQALPADHDTTAEVIGRPEVGYVAFTGSVPGGRAIYATAAKRFIDVGLELGGKDPGYLAEDGDVDAAAESLIDGAFYNAGQSCCGIERVYVHRSLYDRFLEKAEALVSAYVMGDPRDDGTTLGPLAQPGSAAFLDGQVEDAIARGARVVRRGGPTAVNGQGRFFAPALLADCDHAMSIMTEESFGPVLGVAAVDSDDEALRLMNDSPFGLTASVWTTDLERAERMAKALRTGTVFMNRCDYLDPLLAWTGVGDSGKGVSLSELGFGPLTRPKSLHFRLG